MKVYIYYGGLNGFRDIISDDNYMSIIDLAIQDDERRKNIKVDIEGREIEQIEKTPHYETVIAFSDDYASLTESLIESFSNFVFRYNIDNLYLHNPPDSITKRMKQYIKTDCYIQEQKYNVLGIEELKAIKAGFPNKIIGQGIAQQQILSTLYNVVKGRFDKPCVMLFYGNTGVGKTETAKYIADVLGQPLFRKQFSMLHSNEFGSYIFGGKHSQNSLAKELVERESNVVLFDEFDKPNPVFYSAFYQLFDEGVLVDKNYTVKMKNSIIICTSNFMSEKEIKEKLGEPIFSRFDAVIRFDSLSKDSVEEIMHVEYQKQYDALEDDEKHIIDNSDIMNKLFSLTNSLKNARQIKRIIREALSAVIINKFL